jgi:hypothetical protein
VIGPSLEANESSLFNTLYFDDFGDFQTTDELGSGGQLAVGIDQVIADQLSSDLSYVRSDLSSAYNRAGDPDDTPNRMLEHFYRSFLYLRAANVFVVYDDVLAKPSLNARGPYRKHLRWHTPANPVIVGKRVQLDYGQSRLYIDTVMPANATLAVVDELNNPDPCAPGDIGCVPFGQANAGTYRIEVRDPLNPLPVRFLTVLQPGSNSSTAPTDTQIASLDARMIGVDIAQGGSVRNIVLFNSQAGQTPAPITSTSYNVSGAGPVSHTLLGLVPNGHYAATLSAGVMQIDQSAAGKWTASSAGVLYLNADAIFINGFE